MRKNNSTLNKSDGLGGLLEDVVKGSYVGNIAQLMLTNPRDAFRGQSRSPNVVPFDMLSMVSY